MDASDIPILLTIPSWIEDKNEHKAADEKYGDSCYWNHLVGFPKTKNEEKPIFDYEMDILRLLEVGEQGKMEEEKEKKNWGREKRRAKRAEKNEKKKKKRTELHMTTFFISKSLLCLFYLRAHMIETSCQTHTEHIEN